MTFTSKKYVVYITFMFFVTAGISACSQEKQSEAKSTDTEPVSVTMYKNPDCQCCSKWASYMEENGYSVTAKPSDTLAAVKEKYGVPNDVSACHTALIDGYVVEGHVPVEAINKLLQERPEAKGIAVPGMPAESPGMADNPSPVDVYFFNGPDQIAFFNKF
jgi:hypothetical protein